MQSGERHVPARRFHSHRSAVNVGSCNPPRADPIFNIGSTFTVVGTNSPNNFTQTVTLNPGTTSIDGGLLNLTQSIVDQGRGAWLVLDFMATTGNIAGNQTSPWEMQENGVRLVAPSNWTERYFDFGTDGVLANPTSTFPDGTSTTSVVLGTNPITGSGTVFLGTQTLCTSCTFINHFTDIDPFSTLGDRGINPADVNEYQTGLFLTPAPEPSGLLIFITALGGLVSLIRTGRFNSEVAERRPLAGTG